ncbi:hypothetical protein BU23DRAFT_484046, partial [Bimuria novae-zelandiae CBS 107.79]
NFREVVFTDETPARIGEERGMQRTWCKEQERWDEGVKHDRNRKDCALQFYGSFRYNYKGPCHVYHQETEQEKEAAEVQLEEDNINNQSQDNKLQIYARQSLSQMSESDVNHRYNTRKKQYDGAPAHKSLIAQDYLILQHIERLWWPGHSPEVNASEHAWPWIRRHVRKDFSPSCNEKQCEKQWVKEWESMPIKVINRWVDGIPEQVRRIIKYGGQNNFHG